MPIASVAAKPEYKKGALLGESPVWDEINEKLFWVDILSGLLFCYDPKKQVNNTFDVGEHVGSIALRENGKQVLAMKSGFAFYDVDIQKLTKITDPESHLSGNRFNDGKCDPSGRFWAGTLAYDLTEDAGSLYCLGAQLNLDCKLQGVTIPNGLTWNRNSNQFFYNDSFAGHIYSLDYDTGSGKISNRSIVKKIDVSEEGYPDGMTIDNDGCLWVAMYGGSKVVRIDPDSGDSLFEVYLPVPQVTSCTFGGDGFNHLYITTGRENMSAAEVKKFPMSGSLFSVRLPFSGFPADRFSG